MVVRTTKADNGVDNSTDRTDWEEKEPACEVDSDCWPGGSIKVESEPWHQDGQNDESKSDALLRPFDFDDGVSRGSHAGS